MKLLLLSDKQGVESITL